MKKNLLVRGRTVYNSIIQKMAENASEMLSGAAPITFQVKKSTFHADGPTKRGKYAALSVSI